MFRPVPEIVDRKSVHSPWGDLFILSLFLLFIYFFVGFAERWVSPLEGVSQIDLSFSSLPKYTFYSLIRAFFAYTLSLLFALTVGYIAARNRLAEKIILPMIDIGQSIPVLGFLPGLVLGLISIFPNSNLGLELACILLIFTGQVWNLMLGYYSSLKGVPSHFHELSKVVRLSWFQKMLRIEIPFSMTNLAWNSLMSMAGGWFFLTICESFALGNLDFRLPGLGSYMAVALEQNNIPAVAAGLASMVLLIVSVDFLFWRPVLAWSYKFRMEEAQDQTREIPFITLLFRESRLIRRLMQFLARRAEALEERAERAGVTRTIRAPRFKWLNRQTTGPIEFLQNQEWLRELGMRLLYTAIVIFMVFSIIYVYELVRPLQWEEWKRILVSTLWTLLRILATLFLASLWTIPAGIWIGRSNRLTSLFQPIIQVAASFPAPMIYPLILLGLNKMNVDLNFGSVILMVVGVQWYILFNVLAGASTISQELRDSLRLIGVRPFSLWKNLYFPSVFPSLVTGWIAAAGGAWNASIVAEFVTFNGKTQSAMGIGSLISEATAEANYGMLSGCLIVMCTTVILLNRTLWRGLFDLAESRFRADR